MKFLRNRFTVRPVAAFLLLVFIQSVFMPYYSFALTSGSHQPEFTSYEDAGSTDMVNLITGDFNFNIPVIDVPGPEGNFALPLSYHAGIGLEQEASWCGLGFNINAGAINREVNQYPDDASGEPNYVTVQDLTGISGWNKLYNHPFKDDWNSQTGYHGNVNLLDIIEVDWGNKSSVGIVGVHVGDGGVSFNPVQFASAATTVLTLGFGGVANSAASIAKQAAIDLAVSSAVSFVMPMNTPNAPTSGSWKSSKSTDVTNNFFEDPRASFLLSVPIHSRKKSYHIWLDESRAESMYGYLNLGDTQIDNYGTSTVSINNGPLNPLKMFYKDMVFAGASSDINFQLDNGTSYDKQTSPILLASDNYVINAPGVSGSITPYRLETGSVSMLRKMTSSYGGFAPLPFLNNYKVPFIYEGSIFNRYFYHLGNVPIHPTAYNFGLIANTYYQHVADKPYINQFDLALNDFIFDHRIQSDIDPIKKLPQGNNIEWLTNAEIKSGLNSTQQCPSGFIDFLSASGLTNSDRYKFRTNFSSTPLTTTFTTSVASLKTQIPISDRAFIAQFGVGDQITIQIVQSGPAAPVYFTTTITAKNTSSITVSAVPAGYANQPQDLFFTKAITPQIDKGIGGYSITGMDGTTYHFALPIYGYDEHSVSVSVNDSNKKSAIARYAPFATGWLLTSLVGPDFVDRNSNGLVDDSDWGYWVKMNYGKYTDSYNWRIPYTGTMTDKTNTFKSYEGGQKQLYYLNSIETRSHVALFMKSDRFDGLDANKNWPPQKLDEICLLKKEQYKKIQQAPYNITGYANTISVLCKSSDYAGAAIRDYVNKNCLKRIIFNYSYDLCKGTPNTNSNINPQKGKLTLTGLTVKGRNDVRIVPDYKFTYSNNPDYNSTYWDGWGMYNPSGNSSSLSHSTDDPTGSAGSAWSLTKVSTPLGSDLLISYERDTYSSISGETIFSPYFDYYDNTSNTEMVTSIIPLTSTNGFLVGDLIRLSGHVTLQCLSNTVVKDYSGDFTVAAVNSNSLELNTPYVDVSNCGPVDPTSPILISNNSGILRRIITDKSGGNIRTGSVRMVNEFGKEKKIRYLYNNDDGNSSGVVAQEPEYIKNADFPFYDYLKYPQTPVMYGKVSVLSGKLTTDTDFDSKQVFEFVTPNESQYSYTSTDYGTTISELERKYYKLFKIEDHTLQIGKLNSIKILDKDNKITSSSQLIYTNSLLNDGVDNHQGFLSEGTLLTDFSSLGTFESVTFKANRTTVLTYPYTLKKIINSKDGLTSSIENLSWDLLTGAVTQTLTKSSLGVYIKTVTKPAYTFYPELGSKAYNVSTGTSQVDNKNMLLQNAATYVHRSDALGSTLGLISADVQTWRNDWTKYRYYDGTDYVDEGTQVNKVWRKGPAYVWKGSSARLQPDYGTHSFSTADEFNFEGTNPLWQYTGEYKRFDHYGMPLESVDMNGLNDKAIFSSLKMGYDNRLVIANAANARYNEMAFSSAEDKIANVLYFGGEVGLKDGTTVTAPVHTGNTALSVTSGYGFVFKSSELTPSKSYRASVWANSMDGRIYYKLNGGSEVVPASQTISNPVAIPNMGNWYRIDVTINNAASTIIEVGVKSNSGTVVFDDFRFQPLDAIMTCNVYPPLDFEFTASSPTSSFSYVLDNDNLFTKYETNEKGQLIKVYRESITYGVKLISESKNNLRRFNIAD